MKDGAWKQASEETGCDLGAGFASCTQHNQPSSHLHLTPQPFLKCPSNCSITTSSLVITCSFNYSKC